MTSPTKKTHWSALRESGSVGGLRFLLWVYQIFGRKLYSMFLYPTALYFLIMKPVARRASLQFLQKHYQQYPHYWSKKPGHWHVFKHIISFAQSILDKGIAWSNAINEDEFDIASPELVNTILNDPRGQLIIGSHLGNLEYCRGFMQSSSNHQKTINVLLYDKHAANFVKIMKQLNPQSRVNVFQVSDIDIPTTLLLKNKIANGEWVFIAGDRVPINDNDRTVPVNFYGESAPLPIGPYLFAKAMQCPVKLMFSFRQQQKVHFEIIDFADQVLIPRNTRQESIQI
ncbi:MAG: putative LPLAT superfamily acyltransferase, partial [Candidatus Endobugula sp.]